MDLALLTRGVILGFSIAAPVGPIGVLCIRRTLAGGRALGFVSGLGAASADTIYGAIAAFGLTFVSVFLINQAVWLKVAGGLFLLYLGIRTFLAPPAEREAKAEGQGLLGAYASTFFLTLTNPPTIIAFAAVFGALGLANLPGGYGAAASLVIGVFFGSALWWLTLSSGVGLFRGAMTPNVLRWVNRLAGIVIIAFGVAALVSVRF